MDIKYFSLILKFPLPSICKPVPLQFGIIVTPEHSSLCILPAAKIAIQVDGQQITYRCLDAQHATESI